MQGVLFPSTTGKVCAVLRAGFVASGKDFATGVTTQPKLPATKTKRMVTVDDNSGPDDGPQTRRRQGVNVWAEDAVTAEALALLAMAILRNCADGKPITATDSFTGPYEVADDPKYVVANKELSHYFFAFRLTARGSSF